MQVEQTSEEVGRGKTKQKVKLQSLLVLSDQQSMC